MTFLQCILELYFEAFPKLQFWESTLKFAVLQGFKPEKPQSLSQNRAPDRAGNVSAQSNSFGTGSIVINFCNKAVH
jgi:hypothetical protein